MTVGEDGNCSRIYLGGTRLGTAAPKGYVVYKRVGRSLLLHREGLQPVSGNDGQIDFGGGLEGCSLNHQPQLKVRG